MKNVTRSERIFIIVSYILLGLLAVVTIVPLLSVLITSFVSASEIARRGQFILWPEVWDTSAYGILFKTDKLYTGYANTLFVVIVGTALSMFLTITLAYPLSKRELRGRNGILGMVFFTMLFSGGMVPNYILVKELGLLNSRWALVLPYICNTWNMLIMRNFFYAIPDALEEAAYLDGANQFTILIRVILPLSLPSIATIAMFYAVARWNEYFKAGLYLLSPDKTTLQVLIRKFVVQGAITDLIGFSNMMNKTELANVNYNSLKSAAIVVGVAPILLIYPFALKFYAKDVMEGGVKE